MPLSPVPNWPTSLDSLPDPTSATYEDDDGFEIDLLLQKHNAILEALEAAFGINESSAQRNPIANAVLASLTNGKSKWTLVTAAMQAVTPGVSLQHSATQAIANNTNTVLAFNTEIFDTDSMHSTVTNTSRITIVTPGTYLIVVEVSWASNSTGYRQIFLKYNGSSGIAENTVQAVNGAATTQTLAIVEALVAADYVEAFVAQGSGGSLNVQASGQTAPIFQAIWLGK